MLLQKWTPLKSGDLFYFDPTRKWRADKLNLPEGFVPIVGIGLGYADGSHIKEHAINIDYIK